MPQPVCLPFEEVGLAIQAEAFECGALALPKIGRDHSLRLADQKRVGEAFEIGSLRNLAITLRQSQSIAAIVSSRIG